ncbi:hypothetical protein [Brucella intermedia]|nr:hypothetical protein [Brucella intermedia]
MSADAAFAEILSLAPVGPPSGVASSRSDREVDHEALNLLANTRQTIAI